MNLEMNNFDKCKDLGKLLKIKNATLSFFAYIAEDSIKYTEFKISKRNGKHRTLLAPTEILKVIQRRILRKILDNVAVSKEAHGFVRGRSIVTNAQGHSESDMVISLDLRDYFPTIKFGRVLGLFRRLGFDSKIGVTLTKLCIHHDCLPQGAPTSPAIANLVSRKLDNRMAGLAKRFNAIYTRYADDLTFSGSVNIVKMLAIIKTIISEEGFVLAEEKTRIMRRGARQKVTGLVVNEKVAVPRSIRRRMRAILHQCLTKGADTIDKNTEMLHNVFLGHAAFMLMVDPDKAHKMYEQIEQITW